MRELYLLAAERQAPPKRLYATGAATGDVRSTPVPAWITPRDGVRPPIGPDDLLQALVFAD